MYGKYLPQKDGDIWDFRTFRGKGRGGQRGRKSIVRQEPPTHVGTCEAFQRHAFE